jgi:hypothetical protein
VQIWGTQNWDKVGAGRSACPECRKNTSPALRHAG